MKGLFRHILDLRVGSLILISVISLGCGSCGSDFPSVCRDVMLMSSEGTSETVPIGNGSTPIPFPVHTGFERSRAQIIYLASEIGRSGQITRVAVDVCQTPCADRETWKIRMKQTGLASFTSAVWEGTTGWTQVDNHSSVSPGYPGWQDYELEFPFDYDNTSNLMMDFSFTSSGSEMGSSYSFNTGSSRMVALETDALCGSPTSWTKTSPRAAVYWQIPCIRLTMVTNPAVTAISPASGMAGGSVNVSNLLGKFFQPGATVRLCRSGQPAISGTNVIVDNSTRITCTLDLTGAAAGAWDVTVANLDGKMGALYGGFSVVRAPAPTITGIAPGSACVGHTVTVTDLAGSGFQPTAGIPAVKLKRSGQPDIAASGVSVVSSTRITCTLDLTSATAGPWDVAVTNPDNQTGTLSSGFTILGSPPNVSGMMPRIGTTGSMVSACVTGTGFQPGAGVKLSCPGRADILPAQVTVDNSTKITCSFSLGTATGVWTVVVTNPDNQTGAGANLFTIRSPGILYVDADAGGRDDGSSWTDAFSCLQDALGPALPGDSVWVAEGTYKPDRGRGITAGDRTATFQLPANVSLYGGFAGTESERSNRNWRVYATILSGDLNGDDGPDFSGTSENSFHVVQGADNATLDGFTVTGGFANGSSDVHQCGGGMHNTGVGIVVSNCTFSCNAASRRGGAIYNNLSRPTITNCLFSGNTAPAGGGVYNCNCYDLLLGNSVFSRNTAPVDNGTGGAVYNNYSTLRICNCTFFGNTAAAGAAIYNFNFRPYSIQNSIIWGNTPDAINGDNTSIPAVTYSDVQGAAVWPGPGNIRVDPVFGNAADDNVSLAFGSPCIDAGNNAAVPAILVTDIRGNPRFADDPGTSPDTGSGSAPVVDMGAYEYFFDPAACPTVTAVLVRSVRTVEVTFSKPMASPEILDPTKYVITGSGRGSLAGSPDNVSLVGEATYRLAWIDGEMINRGDITITVTGVSGVAGDPIWVPNSGTHPAGGIGTVPSLATVSPPRGSTVSNLTSVIVTFSEAVTGITPGSLLVNGSPASRIEGSSSGPFTFSGFISPSEGPVSAVLAAGSIRDLAGNPFFGDTWAYTARAGAPSISVQPISSFVPPGTSVTLAIVASGSVPLSYQWQRQNGVSTWDNITGASDATYTINSLLPAQAGDYRCRVWNFAGTAISQVAILNGGDATLDGHVTFADFAILQNNYGRFGMTWADGDFNGDGRVTFEDFAILQNNYGR